MPSELLVEANRFAIKAHNGQYRKGDLRLPYVCHPMEVCNILAVVGFKADYPLLAAALLHDVVEDTPVLVLEIRALFGDEVADLVTELSFPAGISKTQKVNLAAGFTARAALIKIADLISNINSITEDPTAMSQEGAYRFVNYAQDTKRILQERAPALNTLFDDTLLNFNLNYRPL